MWAIPLYPVVQDREGTATAAPQGMAVLPLRQCRFTDVRCFLSNILCAGTERTVIGDCGKQNIQEVGLTTMGNRIEQPELRGT